MPKRIRRTHKFDKRFQKLGAKDRTDVINALRQLPAPELYSGLKIETLNKKPIKGYSILQARANDKIRIVFVSNEECLGLLDVGSHDQVRRTDYSKWALPDMSS